MFIFLILLLCKFYCFKKNIKTEQCFYLTTQCFFSFLLHMIVSFSVFHLRNGLHLQYYSHFYTVKCIRLGSEHSVIPERPSSSPAKLDSFNNPTPQSPSIAALLRVFEEHKSQTYFLKLLKVIY